jgi:hypothetical protein
MEETSQISKNAEREFICLLIELYRDHPELWKVKSRDYYNRNKKSAAFDRMLRAVKTLKPDYTVSKLKKKINFLRTYFNREYKAIEQKKKSGASADDIPHPSLWYYNDEVVFSHQSQISIRLHFTYGRYFTTRL